MFLSDELDCGDVIDSNIYKLPNNINIDNEVDPELRTDMLIRTLRKEEMIGKPQMMIGNLYYVIHPVLKHIAILKVESGGDVE